MLTMYKSVYLKGRYKKKIIIWLRVCTSPVTKVGVESSVPES